MKNCRTCKHANWRRSDKGRRSFMSYAECLAPVDISGLPASAWEAIRILGKVRTVVERDNKPLDCPQWSKE